VKKVLGIIFACCALIIAFLPQIIGGAVGRPFLIKYLEIKLHGNVAIDALHLSWTGPQVFKNVSLARQDLIATIRHLESPLPFWKLPEIKKTFKLSGGTFTFPKYHAQIINTEATILEPEIQVNASTPEGGSLHIQGPYISHDHFNLQIAMRDMPTIALAEWLQEERIPQILGSTLNINGTLSEKRLQTEISSPQARANIHVLLSNNTVTLAEPLKATLLVSDALKLELLKQISPNILTSFSLKQPISVQISSGNFQLPFSKPEFSNVVIDLGKATITIGETLRSLLSIFKTTSKTFDTWFTPISFNLINQNIYFERFDILLDQTIHICAWGDILREKLRMTLGVPSDTLKSSFGIITLSPSFVLTIPIGGNIQNPKFDTGAAIARIAAMSASKQIPTKAGKIFGGALNIFSQTQNEENIPPPKRPFPWERG
jgi:hypothetical protein